ncbi:class Ib ribonucleoside-diphosphate reductase assembly flavoprotein NrdI [Metabacillus fastidiosus]|uniref:class Ib ribonucleoside-diphosphate reductase assembly flavoprotein NrdI n=1 Tax=Metabacillus fastidiosus TaxID=1458 RepID=UPI003D2E5689
MKIVYLSLTGNVRKFVQEIGMKSLELNYSDPLVEVKEDYILITPTYDNEVTDVISEFIDYKSNFNYLLGFAGSGNKNFDKGYCFNAHDLSEKYKKPLIYKFEFSGTEEDILNFKKEVEFIEITRTKQSN